MAVSRADRRRDREAGVLAIFGADDTPRALDLLELLELAWNDCYHEITPPDPVVDDIILLSDGSLPGLIEAARLAVTDRRDLKLAADSIRGSQ